MTDSSGRYRNVKDIEFRVGKPIDDSDILRLNSNVRNLQELVTDSAAGETIQVFGQNHGEVNGGSLDGFTKRRKVWGQSFKSGTNLYATWNTIAQAPSWTDLNLDIRTTLGPFRRLAAELQYLVSDNAVRFRIERWNWKDSAAADDDGGTFGTNALQEQTANKGETTLTWHTIDGQQWDAVGGSFAGSDTKLMIVTGPTSKTDLHEMCARCELRIFAQASAAATNLSLGAASIFEVLRKDEGVGEILT